MSCFESKCQNTQFNRTVKLSRYHPASPTDRNGAGVETMEVSITRAGRVASFIADEA